MRLGLRDPHLLAQLAMRPALPALPDSLAGGRVHAFAINNARFSGPCVTGRPERGASLRPSIP